MIKNVTLKNCNNKADKSKKKICCIIGTRPETIKMAPIIAALQQSAWAETFILATAQHREMLDDLLKLFKIQPTIDLHIMEPNQTLASLTAKLIIKIDEVFSHENFDAVLAEGDTNSIFVAALIAFYKNIPYGHVEAGLRSHNIRAPFPEEMNRILVSKLATWHFVPTKTEKINLLQEGLSAKNIYITGNSVIDALYMILQTEYPLDIPLDVNKRLILVTAHRRESFGEPLKRICQAIRSLADRFEDIEFVYPVHPNPNVTAIVYKELRNHPRIHLVPPLSYEKFVTLMKRAYLIMSDSGGIQEEAPALSKPILILRDQKTERSEVLKLKLGKMTSTQPDKIIAITADLLTHPEKYKAMIKGISPYGDGHTAQRIVNILQKKLTGS